MTVLAILGQRTGDGVAAVALGFAAFAGVAVVFGAMLEAWWHRRRR